MSTWSYTCRFVHMFISVIGLVMASSLRELVNEPNMDGNRLFFADICDTILSFVATLYYGVIFSLVLETLLPAPLGIVIAALCSLLVEFLGRKLARVELRFQISTSDMKNFGLIVGACAWAAADIFCIFVSREFHPIQ